MEKHDNLHFELRRTYYNIKAIWSMLSSVPIYIRKHSHRFFQFQINLPALASPHSAAKVMQTVKWNLWQPVRLTLMFSTHIKALMISSIPLHYLIGLLDLIPTKVLQKVLESVGSYFSSLYNSSLLLSCKWFDGFGQNLNRHIWGVWGFA